MGLTAAVPKFKILALVCIFAGVELLSAAGSACAAGFHIPLRHSVTNSFVLQIGAQIVEVTPDNPSDLLRLQQMLRAERANDSATEKRVRRGFREIEHVTESILESTDRTESERLRMVLLETAAALNNLRRTPVPQTVDFFQIPLLFLQYLSRPIGQGDSPASNLQAGDEDDLSRLDPQPSTFWQRPSDLSHKDIYHGFGRTHLLLHREALCTYAGPKESFGRNPGFEIEFEGKPLKLKFAEVSSEPFASRIFDALGYHADPTDYVPSVKVRYSRRILTEFNSRKPLQTQFTFLGFGPMFKMDLQQEYDPFDYVAVAVLMDGARLSRWEFKHRLLHHPDRARAQNDPANFRADFESRIDYLETVPANVQSKAGKSIGPWDFGELDHASRRELRGAGLLAAWLGWFDTRYDNTRLRVLDKHRGELTHYFSDLGGVLGQTSGMLYEHGEMPNAFPWTFTRPPLWQGSHHLARPLRLTGYKPIAVTPAFAAMTLDDARWMARLIAALSPEQIRQALVASGFDSAQARLYLAKLMSRRDHMLQDLGLETQSAHHFAGNRHFSYDPRTQGAFQVRVAGRLAQAPIGTHRIINGKLVEVPARIESASKGLPSTPIAFSF